MRTNGNGNRRPQEIQAEIEHTRHQMDGTLSAIERRLTPGQMFDQGMSYLRESGGAEFVSNLGEQAKQNPMPVALVGIGLAWLMATGRVSGATASAASDGQSAIDKAKDSLSTAQQKIGDTASAAREQLERAKSGWNDMLRDQPLALGAIGLAIGALTAALAPRTRYEDELVGPARDELADQAADRAREAAQPSEGVKPYAERKSTEPPV